MPVLSALLLAVASMTNIKHQATSNYFAVKSSGAKIDAVVPRGQLALLALADKLILVNDTKTTAVFPSEDSRLYIIREARDASGHWRPIEYWQHSWCGNSYYPVELEAGKHYTFRVPVYEGPFRTQMRFVLDQPGLRLVSNEFSGTINVEQFENAKASR